MPNDILTRAIDSVCAGTHLTADHASAVLDEIMAGRAPEVQTGAFLVALRAKGETVAELVGLARTMRRLATEVDAGRDDLVDTAGTGGGPSTFNISTAAALVAAGAGCAVAKHGNRSSTSRCGSADLLQALGVTIDLGPAEVARCIEEVGFGFMFAPRHHAAMKHVVPVRKELAVRTIFNFLGPLTNPAGATRQLLGVSDARYQETIAEALVGLGCERALVVRAADGVDEISVAEPTRVIEVRDGGTEEWFVRPEELGVARAELERIAGGTPEENAATVTRVLAGDDGPARDVVLLNAAAAALAGGIANHLAGGVELARESVDSGAARDVLARLIALSGELGDSGGY
jgi:anthranilate phosphoribosyltransferase